MPEKVDSGAQKPEEKSDVKNQEKALADEKPRAFPYGDSRWPSKREQNGWK